MSTNETHWVACWGNATSITDRREATYARDLTLRYPVLCVFSGSRLRLHLSNLTGTEEVTITRVVVALQREQYMPVEVTFGGSCEARIPAGEEVLSDEVALDVEAGDTLDVSLYLGDFTQMNAGTLITGPLSRGQFAYGCHVDKQELPAELSRNTNWFYFLNTIDILTGVDNHALVCYGDSITAQSWPDYLTLRCQREGYTHVSIIRRAVSGTRILRQYDCATYAAYGLKGATRFPIETQVAGASAIIIQHGINDIIHPVGVEVNRWRPWSDMPTLEDLKHGIEDLYLRHAATLGLPVWLGTLLPIEGWRTYSEQREELRCQFNQFVRNYNNIAGHIDFDAAVRDAEHPARFAPGYDSGDHLHPSEKAYEAMAEAVPVELLQ